MSNSIWKTGNLREASTKKLILYFAGGSRIPYTGWNHPDIMMLSSSNESWWSYTDVMRWCYVDDILAQADKVERLQAKLRTIAYMEQRLCIDDPVDILDDVLKIAKDEIKQLTQGTK